VSAVLGKLSRVIDPDFKKDIVTLGFIKELSVRESDVSFKVELTTPACPVKDEVVPPPPNAHPSV
jgi:ATP-binding protein involved in chromosome partitioning